MSLVIVFVFVLFRERTFASTNTVSTNLRLLELTSSYDQQFQSVFPSALK